MFKSVKNNKGFTLIELLAVIVIMGVLMMVAIPQVTKYINNSRKDAYVETAKAYINGARYMLLNDEYEDCSLSQTSANLITFNNISVESGGDKSGYGRDIIKTKSYVKVEYDGDKMKYKYSVFIVDALGNTVAAAKGQTTAVEEVALSRKSVQQKSYNQTSVAGISLPSQATCTKMNKDAE